MEPTRIRLSIPETIDPTLVFGASDELLRHIESSFDALITVRGNTVLISGSPQEAEQVTSVIAQLIRQVEGGDTPGLSDVSYLLGRAESAKGATVRRVDDVLLTFRGRSIYPKTDGQARYVEAIRSNTITFGLGPAGTGKTYLAMAMAVAALKRREVARIVLTRPVVEAGESLGFLPGTLQEKLDPYIRPLYDALFDMMDHERGNSLIEQGVVEIAPLAFMRGRTLNDAFVILDEAQNTTPDQMKMFLTRLGFSSKFVITGDVTQRDLVGRSGIDDARVVLDGMDDISFVMLGADDVVRHSLVARIVDAYAERGSRGGVTSDAR